MKTLTFITKIHNKTYNFYAYWENTNKVITKFSNSIFSDYTGSISLYGKDANNFLYCLDQINIGSFGNKHESNKDSDCLLTYNDDHLLTSNNWSMFTFPKNVDYLYTAIALCDNKFLNIFKKCTN